MSCKTLTPYHVQQLTSPADNSDNLHPHKDFCLMLLFLLNGYRQLSTNAYGHGYNRDHQVPANYRDSS
ncbi:hypothetical protein [Methylomonas lenta]|uniref:hypothetical protein n=1 Tax=Methylomonas lenta TaxID=980561 RepID=UPI000AD1AAB8|nr:hypothetical protein [Methylomonas lenta]